MSTTELSDLKNLVSDTLAKRGVLGKIKAQLRSSVFTILQNPDAADAKPLSLENSKVNAVRASPEGRQALMVVRDFLKYLDLDYTLAVFDPEVNMSDDLLNDQGLLTSLNMSDSGSDKPYLLRLLENRGEFGGPAQLKPLPLPQAKSTLTKPSHPPPPLPTATPSGPPPKASLPPPPQPQPQQPQEQWKRHAEEEYEQDEFSADEDVIAKDVDVDKNGVIAEHDKLDNSRGAKPPMPSQMDRFADIDDEIQEDIEEVFDEGGAEADDEGDEKPDNEGDEKAFDEGGEEADEDDDEGNISDILEGPRQPPPEPFEPDAMTSDRSISPPLSTGSYDHSEDVELEF